MKITKLFTLGLLGSLLLNSCSSDDDNDFVEPTTPTEGDNGPSEPTPTEDAAYTNGVFVVNEGSQSAGTVSFLDAANTSIENNIFETVNPEMDLGMFVQSIFFDDENAYIISNGSNLITVVDRYTFELVGQVDSGLNVPYYGVVYNGKAYVSNLAGFDEGGADDYVAIINLENLEVEETVIAGFSIEEVEEDNGLIYFEGTNFGAGNSIEVFDPNTQSFTRSIPTNDALNSFEVDNNMLIALSTSKLEKIDLSTDAVISEIEFSENITGAKNLDIENGLIYFTSGTSVYQLNQDFEEEPTEALLSYESTSQFGQMYGFEVEDEFIYLSDAADFASNGTVRVYTLSGELVNEFTAGVGPNGFYFNN